MTRRTRTFIGISLYIILLVAATFVGTIYYNIPMGAFPPFFGLLGLVLVGIKKMFFKKDLEPPPEPTSDDKFRAALALSAGLSAFAFVVGIIIGLDVFSHFEEIGKPRSIYELDLYFAVLFVVIVVIYAKKRVNIIRSLSNV